VFDTLLDSRITTVVCRHEQNAAFIAGGIGRMTGRAGVVLVTSGPGCSNLVTASWPGYEITYRYRSATYRVRVENPTDTGRGVRSVTVDDQPVPGRIVPLRDDGRTHDVRVTLG